MSDSISVLELLGMNDQNVDSKEEVVQLEPSQFVAGPSIAPTSASGYILFGGEKQNPVPDTDDLSTCDQDDFVRNCFHCKKMVQSTPDIRITPEMHKQHSKEVNEFKICCADPNCKMFFMTKVHMVQHYQKEHNSAMVIMNAVFDDMPVFADFLVLLNKQMGTGFYRQSQFGEMDYYRCRHEGQKPVNHPYKRNCSAFVHIQSNPLNEQIFARFCTTHSHGVKVAGTIDLPLIEMQLRGMKYMGVEGDQPDDTDIPNLRVDEPIRRDSPAAMKVREMVEQNERSCFNQWDHAICRTLQKFGKDGSQKIIDDFDTKIEKDIVAAKKREAENRIFQILKAKHGGNVFRVKDGILVLKEKIVVQLVDDDLPEFTSRPGSSGQKYQFTGSARFKCIPIVIRNHDPLEYVLLEEKRDKPPGRRTGRKAIEIFSPEALSAKMLRERLVMEQECRPPPEFFNFLDEGRNANTDSSANKNSDCQPLRAKRGRPARQPIPTPAPLFAVKQEVQEEVPTNKKSRSRKRASAHDHKMEKLVPSSNDHPLFKPVKEEPVSPLKTVKTEVVCHQCGDQICGESIKCINCGHIFCLSVDKMGCTSLKKSNIDFLLEDVEYLKNEFIFSCPGCP